MMYSTRTTFIFPLVAIFVILAALFYPQFTHAAVARQQVFSGTNTTFASTVTTSSVTITAGNLIICIGEGDVVAANGMTFTDSKLNTWTRMRSEAVAATFDLEIWWAKATTGGSSYTVTATDNGGGVDSLIICEEWSGQDLTTPNDQTTSTNGSGTALASGNTAATTIANEIVIGGGVVSGNLTCTLGAGYTNLTKVNTTFSTLCFESKIVSATGAQSAALTASGAGGTWIMGVGTFKKAAAAAAATLAKVQLNAQTFINAQMSI